MLLHLALRSGKLSDLSFGPNEGAFPRKRYLPAETVFNGAVGGGDTSRVLNTSLAALVLASQSEGGNVIRKRFSRY